MALKEDNQFLKLMQLDHFNHNQDDGLMSIEEIKALRLQKQKLENEKKARKYILEINQRNRKMRDKKKNNFFKKVNPFNKTA